MLRVARTREHRCSSWRTTLSSGIYLTDTRDGGQHVGKTDGADCMRQCWSVYSINGHGGNVKLQTITRTAFDTPTTGI
jgi:hypothetical protein